MITKKTVKVPLYPCKIEILIYDSEDEVGKLRPSKDHYISFCDSFNDGYIRIGISKDVGVGVIAHECEHAKNAIWDFIGYNPHSKNDEVDCYLIGWIVEKVIKVYKQHKEYYEKKEKAK